ncbi:MAG: hypothetical protein K0R24_1556, partial [Gammaproteobacteria bacterium]|nr:hypothetical protein [Gammaproteobacteria bacterium]
MSKMIGWIVMLVFISGWKSAIAEEQSNEVKFQDWLKNNGQASASSPTGTTTVDANPSSEPNLKNTSPSEHSPILTIVNDQDSPVVSPPMTYNQSQELMLKLAPPAGPATPESNEAFNAMMQQNAPLTP